jgi:hypothetical protein
MYAHRLTYRFLNRFAISLTELQMTNQSLNVAYMNPFIVFHNLYDYPEQRNMLTAMDAEIVPLSGLKTYASFAVDEIDVSELEEGGDEGREAWGLLLGINWVHPLGLVQTSITAEYTKLTEWLYNHGFPWNDFYSMNFVYEEKQGSQNPQEFHRFSGHHLGANAEAIFTKIKWQELELHLRWISQGEIPIFSRAYSRPVLTQRENRFTVGLHYRNWFWKDRIELKSSLFHTSTTDFHQYEDQYAEYLEFWLSLKFNLIDYKWNMSGLF